MSENQILILTSQKNYQSFFRSFRVNGNGVRVFPLPDSIECIDNYKPDVLFLDCGYEVINGLNLLKKIKCFYPCIPVIFTTVITSEDIAIEAFRSGARDYQKQPINVTELRKSMERLLMIRKVPSENRRLYSLNDEYQKTDLENSQRELMPPNIDSVIHYIDMNLTDKISLDQLAIVAYTSKYHFCKMFKRHLGMSPLRYVVLRRVKKARELLVDSSLNISEVAWKAGFNDLSNFNRQFKRYTGITPTIYKLTLKRPEEQDINYQAPFPDTFS